VGHHAVILDDIWDESALVGFNPSLIITRINCPILAAQEGYSHTANLMSQIKSLLLDAQPLMIPEEQRLGRDVTFAEDTHHRTFFLPKVCNLSLGLHWPFTINFADLAKLFKLPLAKHMAL
jgi:hypothetical protein